MTGPPDALPRADVDALPQVAGPPLQATQMEQALAAIRGGEVDALFVAGGGGGWMFTLDGADRAYRLLVEDMAEGALTLTPEGSIAYANRRCAELLCRPLNQVIGSPIAECFAPEAQAALSTLLAEGRHAKRSGELDLLTAAGTRVPTFLSISPLAAQGLPGAMCVVVTDLTDQKRSEAAMAARETLLAVIESQRLTEATLRESLATLRLHDSGLAAISQGVMITDAQQHITYVNPAFENIFGYTAAEVIGQPSSILEGIDTDPVRLQEMHAAMAAARPFNGELQKYRKDGSTFWIEVSMTPVLDDQGVTTQFVVVQRNVTARRQSQAQLRMLEASIANLNDIVLITEAEPLDEPGPRIVFVNEAFTRRTGYTRAEAIGRTPRFLCGANTDPTELARVNAALKRWEPVRAELINYAKDGTEFWIEMQIAPVANAAGRYTHWVAIERDISERKQAEATRRSLEHQVREAQKMEAIGTLAGGIAHDFNNILGAILGNVALAQADLTAGHPAQARLAQIAVSGVRARRLVEQILAFSRREPLALKAQALGAIVQETAAMLRATLPATVKLVVLMTDQPLHVRGDATQLQQVVLNLCTNAWHALVGGVGSIEVRLVRLDVGADASPALPPPNLAPGCHAHLSVTDNGRGMDAGTRARVFEPFFTTKSAGSGTGLGLSVVHRIVTSHRGTIAVSSQPGVGTRFDLYFPLLEDSAAVPAAEVTAKPPARGLGQHVLYVDDDEVMLLMVEHLLLNLGYRATCLADPLAAVAAVRARAEDFDIVVTDFNMPQMSGLDAARALHHIDAELPVIISSGFISEQLRSDAQGAGVVALLRKEHTFDELGAVIDRALAARRRPHGLGS